MKVSVIIPTYYRSQELAECLKSILGQTIKPMEVIIVDDTPVDAIKQLVEDHVVAARREDVDLIYIKNPKERSISIARNIGVKMARGDTILFVDSDIVLHSEYIRELRKNYEKHPEAVGISGWITSPTQKPMQYYKSYILFQAFKRLFLLFHDSTDSCKFHEYPTNLTGTISCQRLVGANMSFKRSLFDEFEFDENLKGYAYWEDALFSGSVLKKYRGKLLMTPDAICNHSFSQEGREKGSKMRSIKLRNRKYVLVKLFGVKGLLMFGWQNLGLLFNKAAKIVTRMRYYIITDESL